MLNILYHTPFHMCYPSKGPGNAQHGLEHLKDADMTQRRRKFNVLQFQKKKTMVTWKKTPSPNRVFIISLLSLW